ncbi:hypothetical protein EW146_g9520 [Bondarzewia mesenterica]|uniref:Zn(2)-C6 fungal-type domain-containing protein n=1 Tax=Bondarzewia mesenterica TaxID=1095465 RepID=A0A4S4L5T2_9AGAM|nr:hypothetical protein EW146_g9520 [Bondarzewia mesenterica]
MTNPTKKKRVDDQPTPPDAGQRPVQLQRRRVWRACESCRRKKIKCDGNEPTCSQCAASGSQCAWLQTKDRAALSRHYVQELEARLLHMESLFSQIAPVLGQLGQNGNGASLPQITSTSANDPSAASIIQSLVDKDKATQSNHSDNHSTPDSSAPSVKVEDDVSDSLGQLTLDEHGHMRWIGGSSTMSLIQSFRNATASPQHRVSPMSEDPSAPGTSANRLYFPASVFFGKVRALPGPEEVEYPERDLADKLVDAYFSKFHFLMPVVDKPTFTRQYNYLMDHTKDLQLARTETSFIALVFAVFACAAQLVDDPRLKGEQEDDGGMGMVYYERALILHYISHASIQVAHVQCFILMSSFLCSVNCLPQAWILVGQAVRTAQDLGLHRSPRRLNLPSIESETRRKIWWGVYTLDRMLALALGRPLGIEDVDCDVELPVAVDDETLSSFFSGDVMSSDSASLMTGFIALQSLYVIAGRVMRQVYGVEHSKDFVEPERRAQLQRDVEALDKELTKWLDDLPSVFKSNPVNERQVSMGAVLCSHYYSVLTALHRNLLPVKRDQPIAPRSTAKAVSSARACIRLAPFIKNVVPPSHHLAFFIQHLFSSAVIILLYAMHVADGKAAGAAMEEAQSCLTALESWEGLWPGARKCKELLTELTNTAREAIQSSQNGGNGSVPSSSDPRLGPVPAPFEQKERRHSFTHPSTSTFSHSDRAIRNRLNLRRNLSPDSSHRSSRPPQASRALRYDSQRARSASRKRGHDETEESNEKPGPSQPYRLSFPLSLDPRSNRSSHSSPTSANSYPSPPMPLVDPPHDRSPQMLPTPTFASLNPPLSPLNAGPSPAQYDFDFGAPRNPFGRTAVGDPWNGQESEKGNLGMFDPSQPDGVFNYPSFEPQQSTVDPSFLVFGGTSQLAIGFPGMPTMTPSTTFPAPGLPFRGLDYIRNIDSEGYPTSGIDQDLWGQGFDVGAFKFDPEIPFSLAGADFSAERRDGQQ